MPSFRLCLILISTLFPALAYAQEGVAFVQAPEQSAGMCFGGNPDAAFACARKKCAENGTLETDCMRVKWCYPAGWSADVFVQHKEGLHWHEYLCGWQSEADLRAAADVICKGDGAKWLIECAVVGIWNPDGKSVEGMQ